MAVVLPIVSEFDGKGISRAIEEFKNLEGAGAKAKFALQKAALPAAAAIGGLAVVLGDATKSAMEDAAAQDHLAGVLRRSGLATDEQIASAERFISAQSKLTATADDELRPALAQLTNAVGDVTYAQELLVKAQDVAAATGKDLTTVTDAFSKAANGNMKALRGLDPSLTALIKEGGTFEDVLIALTLHNGAAADAANTSAGKMKNLKIQLDEAKESIGAALLPAIAMLIDKLLPLAEFVQNNTGLVLGFAAAIGGLSAAILIANFAIKAYQTALIVAKAAQAAFNFVMSANPVGVVVVAIAALVAALVLAYKKSETFREAVDNMFSFIKTAVGFSVDLIKGYLNMVLGFYKTIFNGIAKAWNSTIGKLKFAVPDWVPVIGGKGFSVPDIPQLANGGIVTGPTLAMIGEAGPEAVIPLDKAGGFGNVTININATVADERLGDVIVNALRSYNRRSGPIQVAVA